MSLHYIIDGYNVIRCVDWLTQGPLWTQRERFLRFIEEKRPHGSSNNRVTVVFDGQPDVSSPPWRGTVRVLFSHGPSADQMIKDRVDELRNPRDAVVVTSDRSLQKWVRGAGARVMTGESFLGATQKKKKKAARLDGPSPEEVQDIDEELKDIWKLK